MILSDAQRDFYRKDVLSRFLRYVVIGTTSDPSSSSVPSSPGQLTLLALLKEELHGLGVANAEVTPEGFLFASLPASPHFKAPDRLGLLAHVDTSPDQPGHGVAPVVHEGWDGSPIRFRDAPELTLSTDTCPELRRFIGDSIVTASGKTLLGADDKAGVAEIMAAIATWCRFPELPHGEVVVCFSRDEEIARGVDGIDLSRLPRACYTLDGALPGDIECECFDAWHVRLVFKGRGIHPGYAKGKLINAATAAAHFVVNLPAAETPEHTSGREGFFHVMQINGTVERTTVELILRDFSDEANLRRLDRLRHLVAYFLGTYAGLEIEETPVHQYKNMRNHIDTAPEVRERAIQAYAAAGLTVTERSIRGGTDGSHLSAVGHPCPNLFTGMMMIHSKQEWIAQSAMAKAVEVILRLGALYGER